MSLLPASQPPTLKVQLSGGTVEVHGLTIGQIRQVRQVGNTAGADASDVLAIALATDQSVDEVQSWWDSGPLAGDVVRLLDGIQSASGMDAGAGFPRGTRDDAGIPEAADTA